MKKLLLQLQMKKMKDAITPSKMLTFYKEGYTYVWDKKLPIKGRSIQYVKLIPIDQ